MTVVTDLGGAHPTWFNNEVDKVFIASDAVMRVAFREGLSAAQVGDRSGFRCCREGIVFLFRLAVVAGWLLKHGILWDILPSVDLLGRLV